jgi:hypothetical protein
VFLTFFCNRHRLLPKLGRQGVLDLLHGRTDKSIEFAEKVLKRHIIAANGSQEARLLRQTELFP